MAQNLDILYVITKASWGGAQRYVYDLANAMKAQGRTVAVAYGEPGLLVEKLADAGVRTIPLSSLGRDIRPGADLRSFSALRSLLHAERPRVVHLNSSKAGGLGALAARLAHIPTIIFTAHGWAWNENRSFSARILIRLLAWFTVILSHRTICVSVSMKRQALWMPFSARKLVVVRNAISAPQFLEREVAKQKLGLTDTDTGIGMISELHPTKRVKDAIDAFVRVHAKHPDATLVVMGEGEERAELENLIREKEVAGRVRLAGFVPDASRYLTAFDIFLHTSRSESFGFAVAEAGFAGLPVIATNVGAIPELIEHGISGTLVPPHSPEAITRALTRYIEHPEKAKEHGTTLASRMKEAISISQMVRETTALY